MADFEFQFPGMPLAGHPTSSSQHAEQQIDDDLSTSRGRPHLSLEESSDRTKRRKINELVSSKSPVEIKRAANLIGMKEKVSAMTIPQALALYYGMQLSVRKYNMMRSVANKIHVGCIPSYHALKEAKKELLPSPIVATESSAKVPLQNLLINVCSIMENVNMEIECKWGLDGSSGHSTYKQKFLEENASDEFIVLCAFVPLGIRNVANNDQILWTERLRLHFFAGR